MRVSISQFLSAANRTIVGLIDVGSSSQGTVRIARACDGPWIEIPTAEIVEISIVDYVLCDDGRGFHKAAITLTDPTVARRFVAPERRKGAARNQAPLTVTEMRNLISANKRAAAFTEECVMAVCWKESSFDPSAQSSGSSAKGLMQMTNPAVDTVNATTPAGVHFLYDDMFDPAKAIQCGTYYLQFCSNQAQGDEAGALDRYGGVAGYSTNVVQAEACLLAGADPVQCLHRIHP